MAPPGHLPVSDDSARPSAASQMSQHGVRVVKLPWAEALSRFTPLFEALAIEWLKEASQKAVGEQLGLSWDEIHGLMERAEVRDAHMPVLLRCRWLLKSLPVSCAMAPQPVVAFPSLAIEINLPEWPSHFPGSSVVRALPALQWGPRDFQNIAGITPGDHFFRRSAETAMPARTTTPATPIQPRCRVPQN